MAVVEVSGHPAYARGQGIVASSVIIIEARLGEGDEALIASRASSARVGHGPHRVVDRSAGDERGQIHDLGIYGSEWERRKLHGERRLHLWPRRVDACGPERAGRLLE